MNFDLLASVQRRDSWLCKQLDNAKAQLVPIAIVTLKTFCFIRTKNPLLSDFVTVSPSPVSNPDTVSCLVHPSLLAAADPAAAAAGRRHQLLLLLLQL